MGVITQNNWNQCEEIKFDTVEDDRVPTEEIDIEIKMEEPEDITSNEESNEENPDEEEDIENEKIREHNRNVVFCWYTRCAEVGMIPKEFETIPETEDKATIPRTPNNDEMNL